METLGRGGLGCFVSGGFRRRIPRCEALGHEAQTYNPM